MQIIFNLEQPLIDKSCKHILLYIDTLSHLKFFYIFNGYTQIKLHVNDDE